MAFWLLVIGAILLVYPKLKMMYDTKSVGTLDAPTVGTLLTTVGLVMHYGKIKAAVT
jgi:3-methyladenine DNA glycosylase Tag